MRRKIQQIQLAIPQPPRDTAAGDWSGQFEGDDLRCGQPPLPSGSGVVIWVRIDLEAESQPHDVIVDADGQVWYSDFANQFVGVMDQKTGVAKEITIPVLKPEQPKGGLDIEFDPAGNVWLSMIYQAGITKIDRLDRAGRAVGLTSRMGRASYMQRAHAPIACDWQNPSSPCGRVDGFRQNA